MSLTERYADRRPEVVELLRWLEPNPRLPDLALHQAQLIEETASRGLVHLGDGPELTAALRKLLEAKDCLVRQALADQEATAAGIEQRERRPVRDLPQA